MVGITSINGFPALMSERFSLFKAAGFESVLLWWGPGEKESRGERVALAKRYGLRIENVHATTDNLNAIWLNDSAGNQTLAELEQELKECSYFGIDTLVVHLTNGSVPPPVSKIGISRIELLIFSAEKNGVRIAFENLRTPEHVQYVLNHYSSRFVGLCYDSGHEHFWTPNFDWLKEYSSRVFAIHLHDNCGEKDSHLVPFDGEIDWRQKSKQIADSSYTGSITIESEYNVSAQYRRYELTDFLSYTCEKGKLLETMIQAQR